jgi:outer membrane receptor protein involved in Fe transport
MPRISFSFPISENASFYANYDVLTITPNTGNDFALDNYYYINTRSVLTTIPNPNLLPQDRTNYEIGFKQKVSTNSAVSVNAYFGQIKNEIELSRYSYAYPIDYTTYSNIDFGTVKGFTFGYDTKRSYDHPYSGITLSANYTLQFADGTGSAANSAGNLIAAGEPQLRTIFPLNWDTRNQINAILDYRFGHGMDYVGPRNSKGGGWLEDAGANLLLSAKSGNPYSAQAVVSNTQEVGLAGRSTLAGTINGSRYPWQFSASLKIDKNFSIASGTGDKKKNYFVNVYLQIDNLLNSLNVVYVYPYTGLPNQDGYLQSTNGISEARNSASQQAFIDQYNVKLNNPGNYVTPRVIRLGAYLQF